MAHINSHGLAPSLQPKLRYSVERDFVPIVLVGVTPNLLIANPAQKALTVPDIVARCKAEPGQVTFGSAGQGSAQHLALEMFKLQAGVDALHVPYKGSGPLLTDLMGGQIMYSFETMTAATPHVSNGKVKAIPRRRARTRQGHPTVPTMQEVGFPGFRGDDLVRPGRPGQAADADRRQGQPRRQRRPRPARRAGKARHLRRRGRRRIAREIPPVHLDRDGQVGQGRQGRQVKIDS
jgi:hypothetical protein